MSEGVKLSFPDCPNKCVDGKVFLPYAHKYVPCEYCAQKRLEIVRGTAEGDDIDFEKNVLRLPVSFVGLSYNFDTLIDKKELPQLEEDSIEATKKRLEELIQDVSAGTLPTNSILINLGANAFVGNLVVPLMKRAYASGLSCTPYLNDIILTAIYQRSFDRLVDWSLLDGIDIRYSELLKKDFSVVRLLASADTNNILLTKGYMQARAENGKPTILVTEVWNKQVKALVSETRDLSTCELIGVEYKPTVTTAQKQAQAEKNKNEPVNAMAWIGGR